MPLCNLKKQQSFTKSLKLFVIKQCVFVIKQTEKYATELSATGHAISEWCLKGTFDYTEIVVEVRSSTLPYLILGGTFCTFCTILGGTFFFN